MPEIVFLSRRFKKNPLWPFSKTYRFGARKRRLRVGGKKKGEKISIFKNVDSDMC